MVGPNTGERRVAIDGGVDEYSCNAHVGVVETLGRMIKVRLLILCRGSASGSRLDEDSNVASSHLGSEGQLADGEYNGNSSTRAREMCWDLLLWPFAE